MPVASLRTPLVVVSNRLPFEVQRGEGRSKLVRSPGGLVTALEGVLSQRGGVWIGWPGVEHDEGQPLPPMPDVDGVSYHPIPLSGREVTQYYGGFSNRTLWPLFHYFPGRTTIDEATWRAYELVNERFAEAIVAAGDAEALVWVHDYQLMRVPLLVRRARPQQKIAFFLHTPFPATDLLRILPHARELVQGLLGADLVGFHVRDYANHFLDAAERLLGCEVDRVNGRVLYEGRTISVEAHPISIDAALQEQLAKDAPKTGPIPVRIILGVDRLDYTKGLRERLLAVEQLFDDNPEYRRKLVFTQIVVPSREKVDEYQAMKREIDELVGRINGRFSDPTWSPIRYLARSFPQAELAALYRDAEIGLVTPLRDGMNLVAKEFVMSQVNEPGVLILSELAGAAAELPEALIVNPHDVVAVAESLQRALEMSGDERRARMQVLRDRVRSNDVAAWARRYLESAEAAAERRASTSSPIDSTRRRLGAWLRERPEIALFLDYDGTLTPIAPRPEDARLSDDMRRAIEAAISAHDIHTVIVSGRGLADVKERVGVEGLTYIGDHGYEIEGPGMSFWQDLADPFQPQLEAALADLVSLRVEGALIERKRATVSYHVRLVPDALRQQATRDAITVLRRRRLAVLEGKMVVEGKPPLPWDKGRAVLHVLKARHGADWHAKVRAVYIGDDATDEFAFRALRGIGKSICVASPGGTRTAADFTLPSPDDVLQLLRWLTSGALRAAA